jgi:NAD+ kinase
MATPPTILLIADRNRPDVVDVLDSIMPVLEAHAGTVHPCDVGDDELDATLEADLAIVIGGDGTMIQQARRLLNHPLPIVPINCGRLGFLASFDSSSLADEAAVIFGGTPPKRRHMILTVDLLRARGEHLTNRVAVNDCVITAGEPFRMIKLGLDIEGQGGPELSGDGLIVATPTGSTAYNVSAGGPLVAPGIDAMVVTPLAAHSLGFRSFVVSGDGELIVHIDSANEGTTVILDGNEHWSVADGDQLRIRRHDRSIDFVTSSHAPYWQVLIDKMRWAAPPTYRDGDV